MVENLICNTLDQLNDEEAHEVIGSFLEGKPPSYPLVEGWVWQVVRARGWGRVPREDIKQETLVALIKNFREDKWRGDSSLKTYVQQIAFIKCAGALRKLTREDEIMAEYVDQAPRNSTSTPEREFLDNEELGIFQEVWMSLSERCREMLFAKCILGQSYGQIAPQFGITASYCKKVKFECLQRAIDLAGDKEG